MNHAGNPLITADLEDIIDGTFDEAQKTPPTWNDAINAMSAEEKAHWFGTSCPIDGKCAYEKTCTQCWTNWLNSPYDGGKAQEGAE